jgi:perosamine synthetase
MISDEEIRSVEEVLKSGMLAEGKVAREFEKEFAAYIGVKHAIYVNSGTAALHLALESLEIAPGSEVITTAFTFIASSNSITFIGGIPIFADISPKTFNIDPEAIERAITSKTKAIMPVHIFGLPANMPVIQEIAEKHNLKIIEDAAQGHGGKIHGKHVGCFGDVGCFSFFATKNMITGEGGMITTDNDEIADKARSIKNHGRAASSTGGYKHYRIGFNLRAPDYSAAIGRIQLKKLDDLIAIRLQNAKFYREELRDLPIKFQEIEDGFVPGNYIFAPCLTTDKITVPEVVKKLRDKGIMARPIYDTPVYQQPAYLNIKNWRWAQVGIKYPDYSQVSLPITEKIAKTHFDVPVHAGVTEEDSKFIVDSIKEILSSY